MQPSLNGTQPLQLANGRASLAPTTLDDLLDAAFGCRDYFPQTLVELHGEAAKRFIQPSKRGPPQVLHIALNKARYLLHQFAI